MGDKQRSSPTRPFPAMLSGLATLWQTFFSICDRTTTVIYFQFEELSAVAELGCVYNSTWGPNLNPINRPIRQLRILRPLVPCQPIPSQMIYCY